MSLSDEIEIRIAGNLCQPVTLIRRSGLTLATTRIGASPVGLVGGMLEGVPVTAGAGGDGMANAAAFAARAGLGSRVILRGSLVLRSVSRSKNGHPQWRRGQWPCRSPARSRSSWSNVSSMSRRPLGSGGRPSADSIWYTVAQRMRCQLRAPTWLTQRLNDATQTTALVLLIALLFHQQYRCGARAGRPPLMPLPRVNRR